MKKLNEVTIEEFRVFRDFTIEQMLDVLQISVGEYESIKDKKVTCYAYCQEINNFLIEEVGKEIKDVCERYKVNLCAKKENIIKNTLKCSEGKTVDLLLYCSKKSASY